MKRLIAKHSEKIRFLITGGYNTVFGYFSFALLYLLFSRTVHYMLLLVISNVLSITNAFVGYRFFVFRSKGSILREYLRFYVVYSFSIIAGLVLMPAMVEIGHIHPLIAQAVIISITIVISYFGHKHYSFAKAGR